MICLKFNHLVIPKSGLSREAVGSAGGFIPEVYVAGYHLLATLRRAAGTLLAATLVALKGNPEVNEDLVPSNIRLISDHVTQTLDFEHPPWTAKWDPEAEYVLLPPGGTAPDASVATASGAMIREASNVTVIPGESPPPRRGRSSSLRKPRRRSGSARRRSQSVRFGPATVVPIPASAPVATPGGGSAASSSAAPAPGAADVPMPPAPPVPAPSVPPLREDRRYAPRSPTPRGERRERRPRDRREKRRRDDPSVGTESSSEEERPARSPPRPSPPAGRAPPPHIPTLHQQGVKHYNWSQGPGGQWREICRQYNNRQGACGALGSGDPCPNNRLHICSRCTGCHPRGRDGEYCTTPDEIVDDLVFQGEHAVGSAEAEKRREAGDRRRRR